MTVGIKIFEQRYFISQRDARPHGMEPTIGCGPTPTTVTEDFCPTLDRFSPPLAGCGWRVWRTYRQLVITAQGSAELRGCFMVLAVRFGVQYWGTNAERLNGERCGSLGRVQTRMYSAPAYQWRT
jgi:hypothetical protein